MRKWTGDYVRLLAPLVRHARGGNALQRPTVANAELELNALAFILFRAVTVLSRAATRTFHNTYHNKAHVQRFGQEHFERSY